MITVKGPVEIKTSLRTVLVSTKEDGQITTEVFQPHGIRKYHLDKNILDGKLNEDKNYE
jgi:hypothetical protein